MLERSVNVEREAYVQAVLVKEIEEGLMDDQYLRILRPSHQQNLSRKNTASLVDIHANRSVVSGKAKRRRRPKALVAKN